MNKSEKDFLRKIKDYHQALLAPVDLFNGIGEHKSEKIIHKLIAEGYIEAVPQKKHDSLIRGNYEIDFFRLSKKGYLVFEMLPKKIWVFFTNDMAKILSLLSIIISILIGLKQLGWL